MAVTIARERKVSFRCWTVVRLAHASQQRVIDCILLGTAHYRLEQGLEFKATFQTSGFDPQFADKLTEQFEFSRIR